MKLGKKLMVVAMAVATLSMVGCNMNEDEYHIIDFDAPDERAEINYTNTGIKTGTSSKDKDESSDGYIRGWATFNTGHETANCVITFNDVVTNKDAGNLGFVWNMKKTDDTYSFYILSFRCKDGDKLEYYISYYDKVGANYLSSTKDNFCDKDGNVLTTTSNTNGACEKMIVPTSKEYGSNGKYWKEVPKDCYNSNGNERSIYVQLAFDKAKGYTLKFGNNNSSLKNAYDVFLIDGLDKIENEYEVSDAKMGAYAMVKPEKTLVGSWQFSDIKGNPLPIEELEY